MKSKRVLFITKPFKIEPLGIMYLSSILKQEGHNVDLVTTEENLEEKISEFSPHFVGYSIMTGDQKFYSDLNSHLKKNNSFFSIAGGPHPTFFPKVLEGSSFDAICRGEGELAMRDLVNGQNPVQIPNIWIKTPSGIVSSPVRSLVEDLDSLPFPDREIVFKYPHIKNGPIKHFLAGRGCPFDCSYCFNKSYSELYRNKGKRVRFRSPEEVVREIEQTISLSPESTKIIYFQDDTFVLNKEWLKQFLEGYKEKIKKPFHCHVRVGLVNEKMIAELKNAGCSGVHIAAEAGNSDIRKYILNRDMTNEQIIKTSQLFKKYGIKTMLQNILGLPFTTLRDDLETLELNIKADPDYAWASIYQPYPLTALGEKCIQEGIYDGDVSKIKNNFFDKTVLNIPHALEVENLQKLFAIAVENPSLFYSGKLEEMIKESNPKVRERYAKAYRAFRQKADEKIYGVKLE